MQGFYKKMTNRIEGIDPDYLMDAKYKIVLASNLFHQNTAKAALTPEERAKIKPDSKHILNGFSLDYSNLGLKVQSIAVKLTSVPIPSTLEPWQKFEKYD